MSIHYRIAVTGHRYLGEQGTVQFVAEAFRTLLAKEQREHPGGIIALSGLAEGSDTLFAEAALELGIPLEGVIAYEGFADDFEPGPARERYYCLLKRCQTVHQLPFHERSNDAYTAEGQWLVNYSDLLVAAWNGEPAAGQGGTGDVVSYAMREGRSVIQINTTERLIKTLEPEQKMAKVKMEEYSLFVEDTARFSERRQTVTNTYITVNGAIAGLITFLIKDSGLTNWWLVVAIWPLIGFGITVCYYWQQLIRKYKELVSWRLKVLRKMETKLPDSVRMYHREDELYPRDLQDNAIAGRGLNFSDLESRLPWLFISLYIILGLCLAVGTFLVTRGILPSPIIVPPTH
ncbi:MAG: hypothetical protein NVSMB33_17860 [Ktedonobacteraceae bacterium]